MSFDSTSYWTSLGTLTGMVIGGVSNLLNTQSCFKIPDSKNDIGNLSFIGDLHNCRENDFNYLENNFFALTAFNPNYPCVHLIPMLAFSIFNTFYTNEENSESGISGFFKRGWRQLSKNVIYPTICSTSINISSIVIRLLLTPYARMQKIDISGHALAQTILTLHAVKSLSALSETGTDNQKKIYSALCLAIAATDVLWMYNNISNYHSIMDVAAAVSIVVMQHLAIENFR